MRTLLSMSKMVSVTGDRRRAGNDLAGQRFPLSLAMPSAAAERRKKVTSWGGGSDSAINTSSTKQHGQRHAQMGMQRT